MNLWLKGEIYWMPWSVNTFLGNPKSHKYTLEVVSLPLSGRQIPRLHLAWTPVLSAGGSRERTGALLWLAHSEQAMNQPCWLYWVFPCVSMALIIISTALDERSADSMKEILNAWYFVKSYSCVLFLFFIFYYWFNMPYNISTSNLIS